MKYTVQTENHKKYNKYKMGRDFLDRQYCKGISRWEHERLIFFFCSPYFVPRIISHELLAINIL